MTQAKYYTFYNPRVQIPLEDMVTNTGEYALYCLPKDGAQALLRIAPYLKRAVTYVAEYVNNKQFLGPTDAELAEVVTLVEQTEIGLMSECGFDDIQDVLDEINTTLETMTACICASTEWQAKNASALPDLSGYVDVGNVTYENERNAQASPTDPATDAARCELAQAMFWYTYTMFTEDILPTANSIADSITSAIIAASTFAGLATFIGIPAAVLASILSAVVAWGIDGAISEFSSWLYAAKDEITCIFYTNYPDYDAAAAAVRTWVAAESEPSYLDKQVLLSVLASTWHMKFVSEDQQENGTWDTYIESGACDDCEEPVPEGCVSFLPCDLDDWDGGTISCVDGKPQITGGTSTYEGAGIAVPLGNAQVRLAWVPRGTGDNQGACNVYLYRVSDGNQLLLGNTGLKDFDELTESVLAVPSWYSAGEAYIRLQQANYTIEPIYWCVEET